MEFKITKLSKKIFFTVSSVIILGYIISMLVNTIYVDKFYLHQKRNILKKVETEISKENIFEKGLDITKSDVSETEKGKEDIRNADVSEEKEAITKSNITETDKQLEDILKNIENKYNVTISYISIRQNYTDDVDEINESFIEEFTQKGFTISKFWIDGESLEKLKNTSINKIYNQGKQNYSLLIKFIKKDNYIFAITSSIEHSQETMKIVNKLNILIGLFSSIIVSIVIFVLTNRIVDPLNKLKKLSYDISKLDFKTVEINTNDEIEELASSVNIMSKELERVSYDLNNRNKFLKNLVSNTSHELKTPLSIIKAFAKGIEDGIDDGSYVSIINEQVEHMSDMIGDLLYWAKYESKGIQKEKFDLKKLIEKVMKKYEIILKEENIDIDFKRSEDSFVIYADKDSMETVIDNLFGNAVKYTENNRIQIELTKNTASNLEENINFLIKNGFSKKVKNINDIWNPFVVLDESRNKKISGTGLGLSIVDEILKNHRFEHYVEVVNEEIVFVVNMKNQNENYIEQKF
ncbi:MAG: HAMP domain-containing histidine kinase [Clostridioides sp.]|jgi:signal transduction histidine kinase|nr:HAMP domain-containing histidine kinase [Clostridioides sp.]